MSKLMYGVAYNSRGRHKASVNSTNTLAYTTWQNMLRRVYCPKLHARRPTYIGCSVSDEWLDFQDFANWFENHKYSQCGYELDKDLLLPGNKVYAPDRCVFVPQELNTLLVSRASARGSLPQGIYLHKPSSKFIARVSVGGKKREHLGLFDTPQEAHNAYKIAKEAYVKQMALKWQDQIASDVFQALMNWELDPK